MSQQIQTRGVVTQWSYGSILRPLTTVAATQLAGSSTGGAQKIIDSIQFTNTTAGAITVTAYLLPLGAAISALTQELLTAYSIAANSYLLINYANGSGGGLAINPTDLFQALASANASINCLVNYRTEN